MAFIKELKRLGLKDKEASVYLSCLELGPSPVQNISRKAKVVRATTYVILEGLMQKGLVTKFKEGKKTLFSAEPPRQLMRLLEKQREEIAEKQKELDSLLPELQMITKVGEGKPTARYFEGQEGLLVMRGEMVQYSRPKDIWRNFTPIDYLEGVFGTEDIFDRKRIAKRIQSRTIFTTKSESLKKALLGSSLQQLVERRFIAPELFPSSSGMTIFRDRIAIGSFTGKVGGVIIEGGEMADMMIRLFDLAWKSSERIDKAR